MSPCGRTIATEHQARPDEGRHVNFTLGMVLGVDDFTQEFAYHTGRDRWLARETIGYGTVSGLQVHLTASERGPEIAVSPGVALSPRGELIRICDEQCASLPDWLAAHQRDLPEYAQGHLQVGRYDRVPAYVVLCYRECPLDQVPIPGEPCRGEEETMAFSRLADDFSLELRFRPPAQREEDALRAFARWLSQVEATTTGPFPSLPEFLDAIRAAAQETSSPPSEGDFMANPPAETLQIPEGNAAEYFGAAFRLWLTELRPAHRPAATRNGPSCPGAKPDEEDDGCVLLAEVVVPVLNASGTDTWLLDPDSAVEIDEDHRPYVVHLRMLQEWLLAGRAANAFAAGPRHR
jgi:hypothetical protein